MCIGVSVAGAEEKENAVSFNPVGQAYFLGQMVEYERLISPSAGIAVNWAPFSNVTPFTFDPYKKGYYDGNSYSVMYRLRSNGFHGMYLGLGLGYTSVTFDNITQFRTYFETKRVSASSVVPKVEYGFSHVDDDTGFFYKASLVLGWYNLKTEVTGSDGSKVNVDFYSQTAPGGWTMSGIAPNIGVTAGLVF
jgi:hypothetical protein